MRLYQTTKSERIGALTQKHLAGGVHYNFHARDKTTQIYFAKGQGTRLWDVDGNVYLDLAGKSGSLILGHNHPEYQSILKNCLYTVSAVDHVEYEYLTAKMLCEILPSCDMVRFSLSGTEAIQNAIRLARAYTNKNLIIKFEGHYHGSADNIMTQSATDQYVPYDNGSGIYSTKGRDPSSLTAQLLVLPWNDIRTLQKVISQRQNEIAAVITEPICMSGGGILPQNGYLYEIQNLCKQNRILFILDEVITGLRMGLGGAQELWGLSPDLSIFGKSLGGGSLPVSCICGKSSIMEQYRDAAVIQAGTFNGYPLSMAAAYTTLSYLRNNIGVYNRMNELTKQMHEMIRASALKNGIDLTIQGLPGCSVIHNRAQAVEHYTDYDENLQFRDSLLQSCFLRYGVVLSPNTKLYPNIVLSETDLEFLDKRLNDIFQLFDKLQQKWKMITNLYK